jgi:hypothetical protein
MAAHLASLTFTEVPNEVCQRLVPALALFTPKTHDLTQSPSSIR